MKRRDFVLGTGALALTASAYGNILGANDRVGIALVGAGRRGRWILKTLLATNRIEAIMLCDVWEEQLKRTREYTELNKVPTTFELDDVLSDPRVEAVVLATPDHLHKDYALRILKA
ncbi:MAG: Gfo/Idh/MocA family oxidoreductase, partial [Bacteroidota bacterium]